MKTIITSALVAFLGLQTFAQVECNQGLDENAFTTYNSQLKTWEQKNPLFRWPLPEMEGVLELNIQFVKVTSEGSSAISTSAIEDAKSFLDGIFSVHDIMLNFSEEDIYVTSESGLYLDEWQTKLAAKPNQFTFYVIEEDLVNAYDNENFVTCGLVSDKAMLKYTNRDDFNVAAGKSLGLMLGLLPTYFENSSFGVEIENDVNGGAAGDFVSDTPFDYPGLANDVNSACKYQGSIGSPDHRNLMANTWGKCVDHISAEQANKIKYNVSAIAFLQQMITKQTTIALNIGIVDPEQSVSSTDNMTDIR